MTSRPCRPCRPWYVYVLQNTKKSIQVYTGATNRPRHRLEAHQGRRSGGARTTKRWGAGAARMIILMGPFESKTAALSFERHMKRVRTGFSGVRGRVRALVKLMHRAHGEATGLLGKHVRVGPACPLRVATVLSKMQWMKMAAGPRDTPDQTRAVQELLRCKYACEWVWVE